MTDATPTLPAETSGYEVTRFIALRHGVLSRFTVLGWEDEEEYQELLAAFVAEHDPRGPTEELAGIVWRKCRLRLAEAAAHRRGLLVAAEPYRIRANAALVHLGATGKSESATAAVWAIRTETTVDLATLEKAEATTRRAVGVLRAGGADTYSVALDTLPEEVRDHWRKALARHPDAVDPHEAPYTADAAGLLRLLEGAILPWHGLRRKQLQNRPLVRAQAFGEAFEAHRLEPLARYEVTLDRKLERTLAMLFRLKELRHGADRD